MGADKTYVILLEGQSDGLHKYEFQLGGSFYRSFENTDFSGDILARVEMLKDTHIIDLRFYIEGVVYTECDRCLREIPLHVEAEYNLLVKFGGDRDEGDIVLIPEGTREIDLKQYLYEFTGLSIPMTHICADTEYGECPENIRKILDHEEEHEGEKKSTVWDALENLRFDKED